MFAEKKPQHSDHEDDEEDQSAPIELIIPSCLLALGTLAGLRFSVLFNCSPDDEA